MSPWTCLPDMGFVGLCVDQRCVSPTKIVLKGHAVAPTARCPVCAHASGRVHSRYRRALADLPSYGVVTQLRLTARRFFCDNPGCVRRVFAEPLTGLAAAYARRTDRLLQSQRWIGLALGGRAGARLANRLGMPTSADSILRIVRRSPLPSVVTPTILGVDDWALRRGQRYGTILCDLERHRPVALLPERSAEMLSSWLSDHPGVEVISRDRGGNYAKGAAAGAPAATQVADRWHLLSNLRLTLVRLADRLGREVRQIWKAMPPAAPVAPIQPTADCQPVQCQPRAAPEPPSAPTDNPQRARRLERYNQVKELYHQGIGYRTIARRLHIGRNCVRRFIRAEGFPERAQPRRRHHVEKYAGVIQQRWKEGCRNAVAILQELKAQGFDGSYDMVRRWMRPWRNLADAAHTPGRKPTKVVEPPAHRAPSSHQVGWLLLQRAQDLQDQDQRFVSLLCEQCPAIAQAALLAGQFKSLVKNRDANALDTWLATSTAADAPREMAGFAQGLKQDYSAVKAALTLPWSNGQVEGQINRLKLIKRQMYGRAKFDLLRRRFLDTG